MTVIVTAGGTTEYTVREINRVPQANLDALVALGAAVTTADVDNLLAYVHDGEEVQFTGVVLTDPYNSGLASWDPNTNRPVRTHVFVRDVAAVTDGYAGMTTQLVEEGLEGQVAEGRAYTVTGTVVVFEGVIQVIPTAFVDLGPYAGPRPPRRDHGAGPRRDRRPLGPGDGGGRGEDGDELGAVQRLQRSVCPV